MKIKFYLKKLNLLKKRNNKFESKMKFQKIN